MSISRARIIRRVTGATLAALSVGLTIDRTGAQQQPSLGTNVNVISGTGRDGDWTLQRQNEPTIACSNFETWPWWRSRRTCSAIAASHFAIAASRSARAAATSACSASISVGS